LRRSWRAAPFPDFSLTITAKSNFMIFLRPLFLVPDASVPLQANRELTDSSS
jgi:hypothetical protein